MESQTWLDSWELVEVWICGWQKDHHGRRAFLLVTEIKSKTTVRYLAHKHVIIKKEET